MKRTHTFSTVTWVGLAVLSCLLTPACQSGSPSNLVLNGGAEMPLSDSTPMGWKNIQGHWKEVEGDSSRHDYAWAKEGRNHFFEGRDASGILEQDIDVSQYAHTIDANKQQGIFSAYARTFPQDPTDQAWITVTCAASSDSNARPLRVFNSDTITSTDKWIHVADTFMIPASTRLIKISLTANRRNGADNDGYFDDISFTTRQTGSALNIIIILITGLAVIAGILIYRNKKGRPKGGLSV